MPRKVINSGLSQTELAVEVYPLRLQLHLMPKDERSTIRISKKVRFLDLLLNTTQFLIKHKNTTPVHLFLFNCFFTVSLKEGKKRSAFPSPLSMGR